MVGQARRRHHKAKKEKQYEHKQIRCDLRMQCMSDIQLCTLGSTGFSATYGWSSNHGKKKYYKKKLKMRFRQYDRDIKQSDVFCNQGGIVR